MPLGQDALGSEVCHGADHPLSETITVLDARIVTGAGGGPDKTIINSPRFLRGSRYRHIVCYLHAPNDGGFAELRRRAAERDCPLIEIEDRGPLAASSLKALAEACRRHDVRVWHGHDYKTNLFGVLLRRRLGFRLVTTVHGWVTHTARTPLYYAIDRWTLPRHDEVIAVSRDLYDRCRKAGVPDERLHLVENAIDTDEFRRAEPAAAAPIRAGVPPGRLVVGAVGRLWAEKGFDLLIAAVATLLDEGFDLELWIAGEGPERERLVAQAAATGHGERIRLLGFCAEPRAIFAGLDLFCLSSRREGLPNVVLEAMAMEVPIVATRCGGIAAFGRDGEDMLTVAPGDPAALAAGLRLVLSDPARRAALAAAARRRVERDCGFRRRTERLIEIYDRLW